MARSLVERHGGEVPPDRDALVELPGVGLKTANVILGNAFGHPAIAVDTHVFRVSQRLGLARSDDPDEIHDQLCEVLPRAKWTRGTHLIQAHGRRTCAARKPECPVCPVRALCPWPGKGEPQPKARRTFNRQALNTSAPGKSAARAGVQGGGRQRRASG
jgi:endonuclease-3